jgi:hypothetical protein
LTPKRPPLAAGLLARVVLSLAVSWHLMASAAHYARNTSIGRDLRQHTRPYERTLGLSQNWNMFAPNPPRSVIWLETKALDAQGNWEDVPRVTNNDDGPVRLSYWRGGKEERYLFMDEKKGLRRRKAKKICERFDAAGTPMAAVKFRRSWMRTPSPEDARRGEKPKPNGKDLEQYQCRH